MSLYFNLSIYLNKIILNILLKKNYYPETNSSHLKHDAWKMKIPFGFGFLSGDMLVSGRVNKNIQPENYHMTTVKTP